MSEINEYAQVLQHLYNRSLILEDMSGFHPVMMFWYFDAIAHLDYSISLLAYDADSPRNLLTREYLKSHTDIGLTGDYALFPPFMAWLSEHSKEHYERFPLFIQKIYDPQDKAGYRSFRIVLNPDENRPITAQIFEIMIGELFDKSYLAALYTGSPVCDLFEQFRSG